MPIKSLEQQGILALHSARALLVKQQTMLANAIRSLAAEFGLIAPQGIGKLGELMALVEADEAFPEKARKAVRGLLDQRRWLAESTETFEAEIVAHARHDETARRQATIPGIGPITASLIAATAQTSGFATVADIGVFKSARHFAAWLGLVPRQHSTGGKTRLGRITKTGNREIRRLLVLGATSMICRAETWNSAAGAWIRKILEHRAARLVTVALANKMARIAPRERPSAFPPLSGTDRCAMAVMTRKEVYEAKRCVAAVAAVAA